VDAAGLQRKHQGQIIVDPGSGRTPGRRA